MKNNIFIIPCFILLTLNSCRQSKMILSDKTEILQITINNFFKYKPLSTDIYNVTGIKEKYITSAILGFLDKNEITIPVNDEVFNHDYFSKNIYPYLKEGKKIKLWVRKYIIDDKEVYIAERIE